MGRVPARGPPGDQRGHQPANGEHDSTHDPGVGGLVAAEEPKPSALFQQIRDATALHSLTHCGRAIATMSSGTPSTTSTIPVMSSPLRGRGPPVVRR